jgi:hypothetical protein
MNCESLYVRSPISLLAKFASFISRQSGRLNDLPLPHCFRTIHLKWYIQDRLILKDFCPERSGTRRQSGRSDCIDQPDLKYPQAVTSTGIASMYFQVDLGATLSLSLFSKQLLSCLLHTFRQGVYLAVDRNRIPIDTTTAAGRLCQRYITNALKKDLNADKLFALRRTGPSMKFIMRHIKPPLTEQSIFRESRHLIS